jgi:hypothetical protein
MKIITLCILGAALLRTVHADSSAVSFDNHTGAPKEWTSGVTGKGEAVWKIEKDATAPSKPNVLKQSGVGAYPVLLKDEPLVKDGFVEVKGKAISGKEDQAIGVIWRAKDANNYYVCRANATEDNIVLYKTVDGKRSSLDIVGRKGGYGVEAKVPPQTWHTLRVEFAGDTFNVIWNGKEIFQVKDATFADAGKCGLWTKADSVTVFDDFTCGSTDKQTAAAQPYPLKYCIVTGDRLDDTLNVEDVVGFVHEGQEFKLCCRECRRGFFVKDPQKYVTALAAAVKAGAIEKPAE